MVAPPSLAGGANATVTCVAPATVALAAVGAPGWVTGTTGSEGAEAGLGPARLFAVTVKM